MWISLSSLWPPPLQRKELGVVVYNCSCLALDLHRVFSFYWQLHDRDYIPSIWSKRVTALYGRHEALDLKLNATPASAYVSVSLLLNQEEKNLTNLKKCLFLWFSSEFLYITAKSIYSLVVAALCENVTCNECGYPKHQDLQSSAPASIIAQEVTAPCWCRLLLKPPPLLAHLLCRWSRALGGLILSYTPLREQC